MAITVVGSVAFDSVETPAGRYERKLAGAATYFSLAASFFTDVRVIAVVGEDFGAAEEAVFKARNIDIRGIEHAPGKCFLWEGSYLDDINNAQTKLTELNVFACFEPKIPAAYADSDFLFLANIDPVLQRRVRDAMPQVKLVAGDTMNYWIKDHRPALLDVLKGLDVLLINDGEARMLAERGSLVQAARAIMDLGPSYLVIKHGEYGATLFHKSLPRDKGAELRAPALPLEQVIDPTGAGDSFAGGFFGYLASQPELSLTAFRRAMFYGSVMGSFACERFGTERLQQLSRADIDARFNAFRELTHID
jgi:sugar/nucleoside kinase (ribokinase family)